MTPHEQQRGKPVESSGSVNFGSAKRLWCRLGGDDLSDLDHCVWLTMPLLAAIVLPAAELLDQHFLVAEVLDDLADHLGAFDARVTNSRLLTIAGDEKDFGKF